MTNQTPSPTQLILLCCHAIYNPLPPSWLLAPYQHPSEAHTFTAHLLTSLSLLSSSPSSLLILSGSRTNATTSISEASSYLALAGTLSLPPDILPLSELEPRIYVEEQALDSYSNLLFSLLLFHKITQRWPAKVTIVTHAFKEQRFMEIHVPALRFPREKVVFVGIDPGFMVKGTEEYDELLDAEVRVGERERGVKMWEDDGLGVGKIVRGKRKGRNHWDVKQLFWENQEVREGSGVRSRILEGLSGKGGVDEEVLDMDGRQPWEEG